MSRSASESKKLTMRHFLEVVQQQSLSGGVPERLVEEGFHRKVVYAKALKAADKGYTDYGVVADRPWLTDKGRAFLGDTR